MQLSEVQHPQQSRYGAANLATLLKDSCHRQVGDGGK
jgi:hypothetical protein